VSGSRRTVSGSRRAVSGPPRAKKRFGQHFLEPAWVARLLERVDPGRDDTFLEIGAGRGALTSPLAARTGRLIAVEIDRDLAARLATRLPEHARVIEADFLAVDLEKMLDPAWRPVRVIGNLPYNVASPILFKLLHEAGNGGLLRDATLMLQKEVADRVMAAPGGPDYGALAIQVALLADVERLLTLPPGAFRPPPKVTSAVVRLRFRPPAVDVGSPATFERLVRGVFQQRRKTLLNALRPVAETLGRSAPELIERAGVDPNRRPQELTLADMAGLSRAVL
jgi:16S rRNA (adenine1518-N6/adenine1519-N6)-dimethyltransferase